MKRFLRTLQVLAACTLAACGTNTDPKPATPATAGSAPVAAQPAPEKATRAQTPLRSEDWRRFASNEILVRFRKEATFSGKSSSLAAVGAVAAPEFRTIPGLHRVKLSGDRNVARAISLLRRQPAVEYAEPNYWVREMAEPDDPRFAEQWAHQNLGGGCCELVPDADIDSTDAWNTTTGSGDVVVAVIDSGIDYTHPDLVENMWRSPADCDLDGADDDGSGFPDDCHGYDFVDDDALPLDPRDHGTHVAGIIGARGNNGTGVAGVAWDVRMIACRFINDEGEGEIADAIACLDYVAGLRDLGVNVVATNNSWGGGPPSRALDDAIRAHRDRGILLVAAAGNAQEDNDRFPVYPCEVDSSNVVCVGSSHWRDGPSFFTNRGRFTVDLYAPGDSVLSTIPGGGYEHKDGTSMAAPQVTGAVALLAANDPSGDWRERKNLLLAGVDRPATFFEDYSVSGGRLNVQSALSCTDATLKSPLQPLMTDGIVRAIGTPVVLRALNIRCGVPGGAVQVTVSGEANVDLRDNGSGDDEIAGDGVYSGRWIPQAEGEYELAFAGFGADPFTVTVDPMLRRGFPVSMLAAPDRGWAWGGAGNHVLVGEIDGDPGQEILVSAFALGPLHAWNDDGTPVAGWPALDVFSTAYPVLGEFDGDPGSLEIASNTFYGGLRIYDGDATVLPGWPRPARGVIWPPAAADLDGDGIDELLTNRTRRSDGSLFGDFELPIFDTNDFPFEGIAVADLDADGEVELIVNTEAGLYASNRNGLFPGFPVVDEDLYIEDALTPLVGDVDADGELEIIATLLHLDARTNFVVRVYSWNGTLEREYTVPENSYLREPILADFDADGVPEIVLRTEQEMFVYRGDGSPLPGWPIRLGGNELWGTQGSPVVGDLTGDTCPEVVTMTGLVTDPWTPDTGHLRVFQCFGGELPGFPKELPSITWGFTPAIADLDGDGRNELVVAPGPDAAVERDALFVYELDRTRPHGPIEWGQYMADPKHSGFYAVGKNLPGHAFLSVQAHGAGRVGVAGGAIDCGGDCIEKYPKGAKVTLTATPVDGVRFFGWRGACTGTARDCIVTLNESARVSAWFGATLSVIVKGTGDGSVLSAPAGISCPDDCSEELATRATVTLTATAMPGSDFDGWSGACSGLDKTCRVVMEDSLTVTARFVNGRALSVVRDGNGSGRVYSVPAGIDCGTHCAEGFPALSTVILRATPAPNSYLESWNRPGCAQSLNCEVFLGSDVTVRPTFSLKPVLTVRIDGDSLGAVRSDPSGINCPTRCEAPLPKDEVVTLWATPVEGARVTGFSGACSTQGSSCNFFMSGSTTVMVHFEGAPTGGGGGGGGGGGSGGGGAPALLSLLALALLSLVRSLVRPHPINPAK